MTHAVCAPADCSVWGLRIYTGVALAGRTVSRGALPEPRDLEVGRTPCVARAFRAENPELLFLHCQEGFISCSPVVLRKPAWRY